MTLSTADLGLQEGFNSFISPCTISLCYQGNTQPADFFAFCINGLCFLPLLAKADDLADTPASIRVCVLSGEVTEISKAAVLPVVQLVNRRSAGQVWL